MTKAKKRKSKVIKTKFRSVGKFCGFVLVGLVWFLGGTRFYHALASAEERRFLEQFNLGEVVEIDGKQVNYKIFNPEKANKTIVLMPGLATGNMAIAFRLLAEKLNARVILVNRPGYGLSSDDSNAEVDKIVEYHRELLKKLEISEPLILMPHSLAGIYAMRWAEMYPKEIDSIIGLDIGSPESYIVEPVKALQEYATYYGARFGLGRLTMSEADYAPVYWNFGDFTEAEMEAIWYMGTINPYPLFVRNERLMAAKNAQNVINGMNDGYKGVRKLFVQASYTTEGFEEKAREILSVAFRRDETAISEHMEQHDKLAERVKKDLSLDENTKFVTVPGTHAVYLYISDTLVSAINNSL